MSSGITRRKGQSGRNRSVECVQCGAKVPRDKAIAKRRFGVPLNSKLRKKLLDQGARLHAGRNVAYYCVSCAKHKKYVKAYMQGSHNTFFLSRQSQICTREPSKI